MTDFVARDIDRRICGHTITCTEHRDGVQRREWVGVGPDGNATFGCIYKSRWNRVVSAYAAGGAEQKFNIGPYGMTTEQAFSAARTWLVGRTEEV